MLPRTTRTNTLFVVNHIMFTHASNQVATLSPHVHNVAKTLILLHALRLTHRSFLDGKSAKIYRTIRISYTVWLWHLAR
jgi:hypothetical protein